MLGSNRLHGFKFKDNVIFNEEINVELTDRNSMELDREARLLNYLYASRLKQDSK